MRHNLFVGAAVVALMLPSAVQAQQITSGIEGAVRDADGNPLPGAQVVITDSRTGIDRTLTTSDSGAFRADGLVTGGPYRIAVTAAGFEGQTVENAFITLQGNTNFTFDLTGGAGDIIITAQRAEATQLAIGPGQSFGLEDLENFPSITRDIRDVIRFDPRVRLDRANEVDRISCLGGNDRSNTFTVDGIIQTDVYGLNGTPFAARNTLPLPFDSIRETSVEFAPYDVQYGQFTGCAINVVTKSGENKFHGSAFFTYTSDSLLGKEIDGEEFPSISFNEKRFGGSLSGPIIPDRLFFFAGYEQTELGDSQNLGPAGAGFPNEQDFITEAQFNEVSGVLSDVYGIDSGGIARELAESSKRYFGRLDWYINPDHRLELSYQRLEEQNIEPDGLNNTVATGINSFESEGTESNYYSGRLYSNWTEDFTTELRVSHARVQDVQGPVGGGEAQSENPIPRIVVGIQNADGTETGSFFAGPGFSRTSNELLTEITQAKAKASLVAGNHTLTVGGELNSLHVFNLFGQNTTGTLTFANINDLRAGLLSDGTNTNPNADAILAGEGAGAYGNFTASGNINDAAADWTRAIFTVYAQDDWQVTPQLSVLAGVRADWFDGDAPANNPNFVARYGFSNAVPFSKFDPLVLPRLGFTYEFENQGFFSRTALQGGVGIFSGGDPTVWFSNAFQNNGIALGFGSTGSAGGNCPAGRINVLTGGQFSGVPQCIRADAAAQAAAGLADAQSVDPNFTTPTVVRANLGLRTRFGGDSGFFGNWRLQLDYIYSRFRNPVTIVDLAQVVNPALGLNGFSVDGRPIYRAIETTRAGCDATLLDQGGSPPRYANVTAACFGTTRDDELQLTNGRDYDAHTVSAILSKTFNGGIITPGGSTRFNLGYAFNDAKNNRFNNGTTATGNFDGAAVFDVQDTAVATSEFETRHNFTFGLDFSEKFFGDYATQFGLAFFASEGTPYSFVFNSPSNLTGPVVRFTDEQSGAGQLLYVPTGVDDPNVTYINGTATQPTAAQTRERLDAYVEADDCLSRYRGQSIARNTCRNDWYYDLDLRLSQQLPGPGRLIGVEDKIRVYADFDNFLNLLDSSLNLRRSRGSSIPVVTGGVDAQGRYVYYNFNPNDDNDIATSPSLWRIQVGVSYSF